MRGEIPPLEGKDSQRRLTVTLGLTEREAVARRARGGGNTFPLTTSRTYGQIVRENVLTFINISLFCIGVSLALLGRPLDALTSTGVISLNILVSVVQEIRAKRILDRIALLTRPTATVVRDGREREMPPDEIVRGDLIVLGPGDQIVADGKASVGTEMSVDESLLTGESDRIRKQDGDSVYSGTYCVTGQGQYVAERVGKESLANQLTHGARSFRRTLTPLQSELHAVIRIVLLIVVYLEFLLFVNSLLKETSLAESVQNSAVIAALVPNGLFLSIAVAYALGAVRVLRHGALIQQSNAIESLSNVDVLCLDKTGTLTTNQLKVSELQPITLAAEELEGVLGTVTASARGGTKTSDAIKAAYPRPEQATIADIPFSPDRKWSAVAFDEAHGTAAGTYVLGAPEMLLPHVAGSDAMRTQIGHDVSERAARGLRVLLLAHHSDSSVLRGDGDDVRLPNGLIALGLVSVSDELRPEARETLAAFREAGVLPKIISGDNPVTVAALARQAGLGGDIQVVSGQDLAHMDDAQFQAIADSATVFGRITPQQKERLVRALRQSGHYVAMIGDGVNDVLALKQANLGVAMQTGSQAARGVADVILLKDTFAVLVPAVAEGQRIINGMHNILKLILTRISTVGLVIISSLVVGEFPLEVRQGSVVTFLSIGVPSVLLAIWARPGPIVRGNEFRKIGHFVLTPTLITGAIGLLLFYGTLLVLAHGHHGVTVSIPRHELITRYAEDLPLARTALATFLVVTGVLLVAFVQPPTRWWAGGAEVTGDWRPTLLSVALLGGFVVISFVPLLRHLFALSALDPSVMLLVAAAVAVWVLAVRVSWGLRLVSRLLGT
jgi:cation-transporting P-type ATPase E